MNANAIQHRFFTTALAIAISSLIGCSPDPASQAEPTVSQTDETASDGRGDDVGHGEECGRIADDPHPEGFAGQGQGSKLIAGTE